MTASNKFKNFLRTTLIGGLVAILPLSLIIIIFRWIILLIERYLEPLVKLFNTNTRISTIIVYIVSVVAIVTLFFFIGLFVKTRVGNLLLKHFEETYFVKIPGYKTAREIVQQFFGGNRSFFSEVVLVDIFGTGVMMTGFITDYQEHNEYITVFVPTGPNPTSGNIYHVPKQRLKRSNIAVDSAIKTIISCGAGSSAVFDASEI
ncbi:MAG: DUF502 domain-containing protein [Prolixibacteraceae bacterium]|jgi:uncharacterized membrane protein|nr:DUF502 domain-containing protein [Prolixibacteraceae bacterium]